MAKFLYIAKEVGGHTVKGEVEAPDKERALMVLREKDLLILKLELVKGSRRALFTSVRSRKAGKVPLEELVIFARQMATMTGAGVTILESLSTLAAQVDNEGFRTILRDVHESVNTGLSLSDAMEKHEKIFSSYFVSMMKAGESSGMLDSVMDRVAVHMEKTNTLQKKVKSAMIYPTVVIAMAILVTLVMLIKVVPVFEDMFAGFGADLPGPTQFLINLSNVMKRYLFLMIAGCAGLFVFAKAYAKTTVGRFMIDGMKLRAPIFGPLLTKVAIGKFTRTLGTLVKSGVPILAALTIVSKASGNVVVERTVNKVKGSVSEGEGIAGTMEKSGIFPPLVTRMIAVGEKSGELESMLEKIADFYDEQVDVAVDGLTSLIEPLVIAFLGVVIGGIVIAMFLPVFKMGSLVNF